MPRLCWFPLPNRARPLKISRRRCPEKTTRTTRLHLLGALGSLSSIKTVHVSLYLYTWRYTDGCHLSAVHGLRHFYKHIAVTVGHLPQPTATSSSPLATSPRPAAQQHRTQSSKSSTPWRMWRRPSLSVMLFPSLTVHTMRELLNTWPNNARYTLSSWSSSLFSASPVH